MKKCNIETIKRLIRSAKEFEKKKEKYQNLILEDILEFEMHENLK